MKPGFHLVERVRARLRTVSGVTEKRMFGSVGFLIRGKLAIGARPERIMCRVPPTSSARLLEQGHCRAVVMRGRTMKGYVHVDAADVATARSLERWIALVLEHNRSLTD